MNKASEAINENHNLYEKFSKLYEVIFKPFFIGGIKKGIQYVKSQNIKEILEVGVGTGYALNHYPKGSEVVGFDVSSKMVEISKGKSLKILDKKVSIFSAEKFKENFKNRKFQVVTSFSVMTVVPDPQDFLNELKGYCKEGGEIVLIMHSRGEGLNLIIDKIFEKLCLKLFGFTLLHHISDLDLEGLELVIHKPISKFLFYSYNHLIILRKK